MKMFGPTFHLELQQAGLLGLPFTWGPNGIGGREKLTPAQAAALDAVIAAHDPKKPIPRQRITYKADIFRRMTDAEYTKYTQARSAQPARKTAVFDHSTRVEHAHPEFAELQAAFTATFGAARAAELLAPSEEI